MSPPKSTPARRATGRSELLHAIGFDDAPFEARHRGDVLVVGVVYAGAMESIGRVHVQRAGLGPIETRAMLERFSIHSTVPEPLRTAHLIAGGIARGESRQRV